jgi:hypothetical protein
MHIHYLSQKSRKVQCMKVASVQTLLSLYRFTQRRVESIATELRAHGVLPKGGRGPYAPEISPHETAMFILAVAGAEKVADAVGAAQRLSVLTDHNGQNLADTLAAILADPERAHKVLHIRVMAEGDTPSAEFTPRTGSNRHLFFDPERWLDKGFKPQSQGQGYVGRIGHVGGEVLDQIAFGMAEGDDGAGELVG